MIDHAAITSTELAVLRAETQLSLLLTKRAAAAAEPHDEMALARLEIQISMAEGSLEGRKRRLEDLRDGWEPIPIEDEEEEAKEPAA